MPRKTFRLHTVTNIILVKYRWKSLLGNLNMIKKILYKIKILLSFLHYLFTPNNFNANLMTNHRNRHYSI
ncbi:hypothetical protein RclHR1_03360004 [Rhizophagus clarus]|uniref:Uncharacterized protein n=1 Tax=Rhizophagus clarus TaxID=94130 RepID=A0A2Z6R962_9GLOM|nr:hypothetical protein RclHR1_03360004 [Rhizophagus clarus]